MSIVLRIVVALAAAWLGGCATTLQPTAYRTFDVESASTGGSTFTGCRCNRGSSSSATPAIRTACCNVGIEARELAAFLENNDVYIRTVKSEKIGYVLYEDDAQVFAQPFTDMRL